eukprot:4732787-Pleurochrysis_carterae.AAC.1
MSTTRAAADRALLYLPKFINEQISEFLASIQAPTPQLTAGNQSLWLFQMRVSCSNCRVLKEARARWIASSSVAVDHTTPTRWLILRTNRGMRPRHAP